MNGNRCVRHLTKKQVGAIAGSLCGALVVAGLIILIVWLVKRNKHRKTQQKLSLNNFMDQQFSSQPSKKKDASTPVALELGMLPNSVRPEEK